MGLFVCLVAQAIRFGGHHFTASRDIFQVPPSMMAVPERLIYNM